MLNRNTNIKFHNYKVNPHNPCLAVYATGSCHVLPFDPRFGGDTCRTYASKYAAKDMFLTEHINNYIV